MTHAAQDAADHSIAGLALGAIVGLLFIFFGLGYVVALACVIVFAAIVAALPGPDGQSPAIAPTQGRASAHAHEPSEVLTGWIRARSRRGLLGGPTARLAEVASRELGQIVTVEEICAAIGLIDAERIVANDRRRALA